MRVRISLRAKLALVSLVLLALPVAGGLYVNEMERFLLQGEERSLLATARAVATALHDRPQLLAEAPNRDDEALRQEAEEELRQLARSEGQTVPPAPSVALAREAAVDAGPAQQEITAILHGLQRSSSAISNAAMW